MSYTKTEAGQQAMRSRGIPMTPRQRSAFILFDGKRTLADVMLATGADAADIEHLLTQGVIALAAGGSAAPPAAKDAVATAAAGAAAPAVAPAAGAGDATPQERYLKAYPIATRLTSALGLRGFRLNLAVEGATGLDELRALSPRIREAVGEAAWRPLGEALGEV